MTWQCQKHFKRPTTSYVRRRSSQLSQLEEGAEVLEARGCFDVQWNVGIISLGIFAVKLFTVKHRYNISKLLEVFGCEKSSSFAMG